MTTITATQATTQPAQRTHDNYGRLWLRVPQELGFLLLNLPIAVISLVVLSTLFFTGLGLIAILVGVFITVAAMYTARALGTLELLRLQWAGRPRIARPQWEKPGETQSFWRITLAPFADGHYWLYLLHGMVVAPIIGILSWTISFVWLTVGLTGATSWIWQRALPDEANDTWLHELLIDWAVPGAELDIDPVLGESLLYLAIGLIFLATLPLVTRGLTLLHNVVARGMLSAWRSEALSLEVASLSASRGAAVLAEDQSLRRLERDIHDGPQQRLVRLQMDLASAERKIDADPDAAKALLTEAREQARDTLEELRALSRGFAPPILQDRGLIAGLESLAARSTIPVSLELQLDPAIRLAPEIERSAYFVAAELLTNAAKHSGAGAIRLHLALRAEPSAQWLDLWVIDNGSGGAEKRAGHGLSGLEDRLTGLRGVLSIDSPLGGPTAVGAHIPLPR
ncbi:signal transduction histidine kinase [Microterricola gilva]|uniref:histidine kinase n=1 Tax=Microterricola gilva TaxID=393267 RepID=A0A4Q8AK55_9MICO|nr:sensor histidine kinase [Microterricola gilva]RZU64882.1 signal transduction histidine kinase [Microterricola gilva]